MTNREIGEEIADLLSQADETDSIHKYVGLKTYVEFILKPRRFSQDRVGYRREDIINAVEAQLDEVRIKGKHFM